MSIDLVLFDLDAVLVEYSHEVRCRTHAARIGMRGHRYRDHASLCLALSKYDLLENHVHAP